MIIARCTEAVENVLNVDNEFHQSQSQSPARERKRARATPQQRKRRRPLMCSIRMLPLTKHLSECPLHPVPCPHKCGQMVLCRNVETHGLECKKNMWGTNEVQAPILMLGFLTSWSFATRPEKNEKDTRNDMLVPLGLENRSQKL